MIKHKAETQEGMEMLDRYRVMSREELSGNHLHTDTALANEVSFLRPSYETLDELADFMLVREAAKERIRWLAAQLDEAERRIAELEECI